MERQYNLSISGRVRPGAEQHTVISGFARLARISESQARAVFARAPVVIKKGLDEPAAQKFKAALESIGAEVMIEAAASSTPCSQEPASDVLQVQVEEQPGYQYHIEGRPDFAFLTVQIPPDETLKVEAGAMATMDTHLRMKTRLKGGLSRLVTGESVFIDEFTAEGSTGEIGIAPGPAGDMAHVYLDGDTLYLQDSAFVAAAMGVELDSKWQGLIKGFFSGERLFLIRASGYGDLWFNAYGSLIEIDVDGEYVVDTGKIVAFTEGLDYRVTSVGGYKSLFFSGEGLVCRFSGKGRVWIQSRSVPAFALWANDYRRVVKRKDS